MLVPPLPPWKAWSSSIHLLLTSTSKCCSPAAGMFILKAPGGPQHPLATRTRPLEYLPQVDLSTSGYPQQPLCNICQADCLGTMVCIMWLQECKQDGMSLSTSWHFHDAGHYYRPFCTLNSDRCHIWSSHTTCRQHLWAQMLGFLTWKSFYCQTLTPCLTTGHMNSLAQHAIQSYTLPQPEWGTASCHRPVSGQAPVNAETLRAQASHPLRVASQLHRSVYSAGAAHAVQASSACGSGMHLREMR